MKIIMVMWKVKILMTIFHFNLNLDLAIFEYIFRDNYVKRKRKYSIYRVERSHGT